jgi:DNA polymerase
MGNPSTQTLLGVKEGITRIRGSWREYEIAPGKTIPALPTLHPAYLLRTPAAKRGAWLDLRALKRVMEGAPP